MNKFNKFILAIIFVVCGTITFFAGLHNKRYSRHK